MIAIKKLYYYPVEESYLITNVQKNSIFDLITHQDNKKKNIKLLIKVFTKHYLKHNNITKINVFYNRVVTH